MGVQFMGVGSLGTEVAAGNGRLGIAFDGNQLAFFVIYKLAAANSAIWTNRSSNLRTVGFWTQVARSFRHRLRTGAVGSGADLLKQWPLGEELSDHC